MNLGIVSYCDHFRTLAHVNHENYARKQGYTYIFDIAPTHAWKFSAKLEKIAKFLPLFDWVFWVDDDGFFMQTDRALEPFIRQAPDATFIFCESPINDEKWTWLSSGNFLVRNTPLAKQFLQDVIDTDLDVVRDWWDAERFGWFTRGDQDAIVYQLHTNPAYQAPGFVHRLGHEAFNSRPSHFVASGREHFLVHFTGGDKGGQALEFAEKWKLSDALTWFGEFKEFKGIYRPATG